MILSYRINGQEHNSWKSTYLPLMTSCGKKGRKETRMEGKRKGKGTRSVLKKVRESEYPSFFFFNLSIPKWVMAAGSHGSWPGERALSIFWPIYLFSRTRNLDVQGCDEGVCMCTKSTAKIVQKAGLLKTSEEIFILDTHSMISILEAGILQHLE